MYIAFHVPVLRFELLRELPVVIAWVLLLALAPWLTRPFSSTGSTGMCA